MTITAVIAFCLIAAIGIAAQWFRYKSALRTLRPPKGHTDEPPADPTR